MQRHHAWSQEELAAGEELSLLWCSVRTSAGEQRGQLQATGEESAPRSTAGHVPTRISAAAVLAALCTWPPCAAADWASAFLPLDLQVVGCNPRLHLCQAIAARFVAITPTLRKPLQHPQGDVGQVGNPWLCKLATGRAVSTPCKKLACYPGRYTTVPVGPNSGPYRRSCRAAAPWACPTPSDLHPVPACARPPECP